MAKAEIQLDSSLKPAQPISAVHTDSGIEYSIKADMGKEKGANLFYSFETFNLYANEIAQFHAHDNTQNIISRVTGGSKSWLDGTLQTIGSNANFFFLNPFGIHIGKNAKLDINGSVYFSTAHKLKFPDNKSFDASKSNGELSIDPPEAFGFLDAPADIHKEYATLELVPTEDKPNLTLALIGGNISIKDFAYSNAEEKGDGYMRVKNGNIHLISVAGAGNVPVDTTELKNITVQDFGTLEIRDDTALDDYYTRQDEFAIANIDTSGDAGGNVYIRAKIIDLDHAYIYADKADDNLDIPIGNSNFVTLKADQITLKNGSRINAEAFEDSQQAGKILLDAKEIIFTKGSELSTRYTANNPANITIIATEKASFIEPYEINSDSTLLSGIAASADVPNAESAAGNIVLCTQELQLDGGLIESNTIGDSQAGTITLRGIGTLNLTNGAKINAGSSSDARGNSNPGRGGLITIENAGDITITGEGSGIFNNTFTEGSAGGIVIDADTITLRQGGHIEAGTRGSGSGGDIRITAQQISLDDYAKIRTTSLSEGENNGSVIQLGNAGEIFIKGENLLQITNHSEIAADAKQADGGNIEIQAPRVLKIDNNSDINTAVSQDFGTGGNITIQAGVITLTNDSKIKANARQGQGGNITISALSLFNHSLLNDTKADDDITASSEISGLDGEITIDTTDTLIVENANLPIEYTVEQPYNCLAPAQRGVLTSNSRVRSTKPGDFIPALHNTITH